VWARPSPCEVKTFYILEGFQPTKRTLPGGAWG
jgi:hypothetical protein